MIATRAVLLAAFTVLTVTACGGRARPQAPSSPSPPAAATSCADLADVMEPVVSDQASQDADQTQNWVGLVPARGGGSDLTSQGVDLKIAARAAWNATGDGQLADGARVFSDAAGAFLADQGDGLMPGWDQEYKPLEASIKAIAVLCGYPGSMGA